jgi:hypothetical protein
MFANVPSFSSTDCVLGSLSKTPFLQYVPASKPVALTIYSMYLRLNLSTVPDLNFQKPQHCTVLDPITGNFKAS